MTSWIDQWAPHGRDEFGFAELEFPQMSSGWVTINIQAEGVFVSCVNQVSENVGKLREWDTIKTREGKFYIQCGNTWVQTFSEYFGQNAVFGWNQFVQEFELATIPVEGKVFAVMNSWS